MPPAMPPLAPRYALRSLRKSSVSLLTSCCWAITRASVSGNPWPRSPDGLATSSACFPPRHAPCSPLAAQRAERKERARRWIGREVSEAVPAPLAAKFRSRRTAAAGAGQRKTAAARRRGCRCLWECCGFCHVEHLRPPVFVGLVAFGHDDIPPIEAIRSARWRGQRKARSWLARQHRSNQPLGHQPVGAFQDTPSHRLDAPGKSWWTLLLDAIPEPRAFPVASELLVQPCRCLTVAHADAVDVRSRSQEMIAHGQMQQRQRRAPPATVERRCVCKYRCAMRSHVRHLETHGSFEERARKTGFKRRELVPIAQGARRRAQLSFVANWQRSCRFVTHAGNARSFPLCSLEIMIMAAAEVYAGFGSGTTTECLVVEPHASLYPSSRRRTTLHDLPKL